MAVLGNAKGRRRFFRDVDGYLTAEKRYDEIVNYELDFSDDLVSGETISSQSWDASGVTISNEAISSPNGTDTGITFTVTGTGTAEVTVTTSSSQKFQLMLCWEDGDYRNRDY